LTNFFKKAINKVWVPHGTPPHRGVSSGRCVVCQKIECEDPNGIIWQAREEKTLSFLSPQE